MCRDGGLTRGNLLAPAATVTCYIIVWYGGVWLKINLSKSLRV